MTTISLKATQEENLATAINAVSHGRSPEDHPVPLTGDDILIYGAYEPYATNWWGWEYAVQVTLGPYPGRLHWPGAGTHKFKFVPADMYHYFWDKVDLSFLTDDDLSWNHIEYEARVKVRQAFIDLCEEKGIKWTSLFSDIQLPIVTWDNNHTQPCLEMYFTTNVVFGPVRLQWPPHIDY